MLKARWADKVITIGTVSDRIMYIDLVIHGRTYRIISVYMPHAGYPADDFNMCLDRFREIGLQAVASGYKFMVGGDFNTQINAGWRSERLTATVEELGMAISNYPDDLPYRDAWTFRSCLGHYRVLDYVFVSTSLNIKSAKAISDLDLGSDHRTVQTCIEVPTPDSGGTPDGPKCKALIGKCLVKELRQIYAGQSWRTSRLWKTR